MKKLILASLLAVITTITLSGCIKIYPQAPDTTTKETQTTKTTATEPPAKTENTLPKAKETKMTTQTETTSTETERHHERRDRNNRNRDTETTATQAEEDKNEYQKEGEHWAKEFSNPDLTDAERAQLGKEKGDYYRNKYGR